MPKWFCLRNWNRFQSYGDRKPIWIKVYTSLQNEDSDWAKMDDAIKGQFIGLLLLAARFNNVMAYDPDFVADEIMATDPFNFDNFLDHIEVFDSSRKARNYASNRYRIREEEESKKGRVDKKGRKDKKDSEKKKKDIDLEGGLPESKEGPPPAWE